MATPESKVKAEVKKVLDNYKGRIYYYMPVPGGYGATTLDYLGAFYGFAFAIETKRGNLKATPRQEGVIADMRAAGMRVFVINESTGTAEFEAWLERIEELNG